MPDAKSNEAEETGQARRVPDAAINLVTCEGDTTSKSTLNGTQPL